MEKVNGKYYPMWGDLMDQKDKWIGKTLTETEFGQTVETPIVDLTFEPNGDSSAYFSVVGEDFTCGFDVKYGGISGGGTPGSLSFYTTFGINFEIG